MSDETLLERLRAELEDDPNISEKRMFGALAFMLNGNMLCAISSKGEFMARIGKDQQEDALTRPGARPFESGQRSMGGVLLVEEEELRSGSALKEWLALCFNFVGSLPPK